MHKALWISGAIALVVGGIFAGTSSTEARKVFSSGKINGPVVLHCSPGMNESWRTFHAPRDRRFYSQRIVLGEGEYVLSARGRFRFNGNLWTGDNDRFVGGQNGTSSFAQRVKVTNWDTSRKYLFQARKLSNTCNGCSMTMSVRAVRCSNASNRSNRSTAPACRPNECQSGTGLFGLPNCVPKRGANGGKCGTPGN